MHRMRSLWFLCLFIVQWEATRHSIGGVNVVWGEEIESPVGLIELNEENFLGELSKLQDHYEYMLIEFMAHWCPACKAFQPTYENVAKYLDNRGTLLPRIIVGRIDCANDINKQLCIDFGIRSYPTMFVGKIPQIRGRTANDISSVEPASRTVEGVVHALEDLLDVQFDKDAFENEGAIAKSEDLDGKKIVQTTLLKDINFSFQADWGDIEGATTQSWEYLVSPVLLKGSESREALEKWLHLLSKAHPVSRCRNGADNGKRVLDQVWPRENDSPKDISELANLKICGQSPFKTWGHCAEEASDSQTKGGYTCALWQLFHSLAAGLPEDEILIGQTWLISVRGFVKNFFQCSDCAQHFVGYASSDDANAIVSKKEAMMWLWKTHNDVNKRLSKSQWPTKQMCSVCIDEDGNWNHGVIAAFLEKAYSLNKASPSVFQSPSAVDVQKTNGWGHAILFCGIIATVVYGSLRGNVRYSIKRQYSRRNL